MYIEYFYVSPYGHIHKSRINTTDKNYISHNDESVTFTDSYVDEYWDTQYHEVTRTRIFEVLRQKMINDIKDRIKEFEKDLAEFENAKNYEEYINKPK